MVKQLLKECLGVLDRFSYEPDEDSMCNSYFRATMNEDMFFDLKHRIEKYLKENSDD